MDVRRLRIAAMSGAMALALSACGPDPTETADPVQTPPVTGTAPIATPDYGLYDDDIDTFLGDYVRDDEMFVDDNLDYEVEQGVVTVTGDVDSQQELTALQTRIRRVPGVRDVNVTAVRMGAGG